MHKALIASTWLAILLSGCAHDPANSDISGIWINQQAIDAAAKAGPLLNSLYAYGPNLEWNVNTKDGQVRYFSNGFESIEGKLLGEQAGLWQVDFSDHYTTELKRMDGQLKQNANQYEPEQVFNLAQYPATAGAPLGTTFKHALYAAYMGGAWEIIKGQGTGHIVHFTADGKVCGLPGADRYALCLGGDCANMNGGFQDLWLAQGAKQDAWLFTRKEKQLEIFKYINTSLPDEQPTYVTTTLEWLLEKQ